MNDNLTITPHEPDEISNGEDMLDSRDVQERLDWLETVKEPTADEIHEQKTLNNLKEQYVNDYGESSWEFGAQFIRDSYFEDYARELADDIGAIDEKQSWPTMFIDWERAADALQEDYTEVEFDGVTYYTREA